MNKRDEAILDNHAYCNELAGRINKLTDAILFLVKRLEELEKRVGAIPE